MTRSIQVLIVDDSILCREGIARGLTRSPGIQIVAKVADPMEGLAMAIAKEPDIILCDVEMPRMNGMEFVRRLMAVHPVPVIIMSRFSDAAYEAIQAGAVDFASKPESRSLGSMETFALTLMEKIKAVVMAPMPTAFLEERSGRSVVAPLVRAPISIIAMGASTGGIEAVSQTLMQLPAKIPGIVVVQHIPAVFSRMFAERLNRETRLSVKEAVTGDVIETGTVLIAPGEKHMRVRHDGQRYVVECSQGERVNGHCPSVDVLFESVARACKGDALGVLFTGMGRDGARGLLAMRNQGACTIGQDEATSVVYGMPRAAFEIGAVERQVPLHQMAELVVSTCGIGTHRELD